MKHIDRSKSSNVGLAALFAAGLMFGTAHNALAAGTASGTVISNSATLNYDVGGIPQETSPSNAVTFVVDNKINLLVAETGGTLTVVTPGQTSRITTFTVTNAGNTVQDYVLAANAGISGGSLFGGTDNFDVTSCARFVESGAQPGTFDGAADTATFIDELAIDASKTVYVVCNVPVAQSNGNGNVSLVSLTATTHAGGAGGQGAVTVEDTGPDNPATVQTVFADSSAGDAQGDNAARNGQHSARDGYTVVTSVINVTKSLMVLCDPFNGARNPKNIPGAIVRWTITISNTGSASATLGTISDVLDISTTHDANLTMHDPDLASNVSAATCFSATGAVENAKGNGFQIEYSAARTLGGTGGYMSNVATGNDGASIDGQTATINFLTALPVNAINDGPAFAAGELKAGDNTTVTFNVTVDDTLPEVDGACPSGTTRNNGNNKCVGNAPI